MYKALIKNFSDKVCTKFIQYVKEGGGLLMGFRGWVDKYYG